MAKAYGIKSAREIFGLSWRRFRVLFGGEFSFTDPEEGTSVADSVDWDRATGREPASVKREVSVSDFLGRGI